MEVNPIGCVLFYHIQAGACCFSLMSGVVSARLYVSICVFVCNECCCMNVHMSETRAAVAFSRRSALCRAMDREQRAVAALAAAAFSAGGSISVSSIGRRTGMSGRGAKRGAVDPAPGWSAYRSGPGPRSTAPPERTKRNGVVDPEPGWSAHVSGPGPRSTTP